jgi:cytochrome c peroxidase
MHTNNQSLDVGTGGTFQVPSLVGVGTRAPYLHDGTAPTIEAAIRAHAGGSMDDGALADLAAALRTM